MKKIIAGLLVLLTIALAAIYLLIPNTLTTSTRRFFAGNANAAYRNLITQPDNWQRWLDTADNNAANQLLKNYSFKTIGSFTNYNDVIVKNKNADSFASRLQFFPVSKDSFLIWWQTETVTGYNPFKKIQAWRQQQTKADIINQTLDKFERFMLHEDKVYGATIKNVTVVDTLLIATYLETDTIPSVKTIDGLFKELHQTIAAQHADIQDSGMMHVTRLSPTAYKTMVAIPIKQKITPGPTQVIKRMIPGNILLMEGKGGPYSISKASQTLQLFVTEHGMVSPAIPFEKLITNRVAESDTSKWVTWFYYPVY